MITLTPHECRVLGVMIEKAQTTPAQYPLTLNGLVTGCNQRNNRDPVLDLDETAVMDALDGLRQKKLVMLVDMAGSRVPKYRHLAREGLGVETAALVVLAELLMRGPQTLGELRGRASRMFELESMEVVTNVLRRLMDLPEPMVRELPPSPGTRAVRYAQLLCPELHPLDHVGHAEADHAVAPGDADLAQRVAKLEAETAALRQWISQMATALGVPDPTQRSA